MLIDHLAGQEMLSVVKREKAIYVWGQVEYQDIFGNPQWTEIRAVSAKVNDVSRLGFNSDRGRQQLNLNNRKCWRRAPSNNIL